jgi:hypothetical protein
MSSAATSAFSPRHRLMAIGVLVLIAAGVLTGCGSSSSSKPAYCSDVTNFKNAVEQLTKVTSPSGLAKQAQKVASTGQTALSAVKTGFAPETNAVKSALAALDNSAKQLSSSSTRASAIAAIPGEARALSTAAENLFNAAKSNCT